MSTLLQDLKYAFRMLIKSPAFALVAVLSLALGIGANAAIFTLVDNLLLNPLPGVDAGRVVALYTTDQKNTGGLNTYLPTSYLNAKDYREMNDVFSGLAITGGTGVTLDVKGNQVPLNCETVSGNYFDVLGVKPNPGRGFLPEEDDKLGAYPVTVLSYDLWQDQFGGDAGLVGKTITLNHQSFTVVGIAPKDFNGEFALGGPDLWIPNAMHQQIVTGQVIDWYNERRGLGFGMLARLKPGVTVERAQSSMAALAKHLELQYPDVNKGRGLALLPLVQASINPNTRGLFVRAGIFLQGIVGLVLLIACANVANLLLVRGARRQREMSVRLSLGASRWRIVRQLLAESLMLSLLAGAAGILVAYWTIFLLRALRPPFIGNALSQISINPRMLVVSFLIAMGTGVLFGLAPARQAARTDLMLSLRDRLLDPSLHVNRWFAARNFLVIVQVTLSLVALVGAGLFLRSLGNAQRIDPGFNTKDLALLPLNLAPAGYDNEHARQFYQQVTERIRALPMVESVSVGVNPPFAGGFMRTVFPEGVDPTDRRAGKLTLVDPVDPDYFNTLGIPILRGRGFTAGDNEKAPMVAIINQTQADRLWPGKDPIGRHLKFFGTNWNVEVVGVAHNSKYINLGEDPQGYIYFPLNQQMATNSTLYVRTKSDPAEALGSIRSAVQALDPHLSLNGETTMTQVLDRSLGAPRMGAELLGAFGLLALVLAAMGIYGVMAYSVTQRTHELGVRVALGAQTMDIMRMVLGHSMTVVGAGVVVGMCIAAALTRFMASLLFGLSPHDPITLAGVAAIMLGVALIASFIPARRATRVDPVVALRHE
jgi:putative ABC transport system permease protein